MRTVVWTVLFGGAKGQAGQIFIQTENHRFDKSSCEALVSDANCEDMGALFFDADSDGDQDLYVVSGGVECEPAEKELQDRLYLNDGNGKLSVAEDGVLPDLRQSGSTVCGADFDRDGDLDLFVGARVIPGRWPVIAAFSNSAK